MDIIYFLTSVGLTVLYFAILHARLNRAAKLLEEYRKDLQRTRALALVAYSLAKGLATEPNSRCGVHREPKN